MQLCLDTASCMTIKIPFPDMIRFIAHLGAKLNFHEAMAFRPEKPLFLQIDVLQPLVSLV